MVFAMLALVLALAAAEGEARERLAAFDTGAEAFDPGDPGQVAALMRELGYEAELERDGEGPVIFSRADGLHFGLWFYDCSGPSVCGTVIFELTLEIDEPMSLRLVNEWNRDAFMGRAYLDDWNDAVLEHYTVVEGGMPPATFEAVLGRWREAMGEFAGHMGF